MAKIKWMAVALISGLLSFSDLSAHGKLDVGPVYMHADVLENGKTTQKLDLIGVRADGYLQIIQGLILKPSVTAATHGHGKYSAGTIALGYYIPCGELKPNLEGLSVLPHGGITQSRLETHIDIPSLLLSNQWEIFRSTTPYIGLEATYRVSYDLSVSGSVVYGWSKTHTTIGSVVDSRSSTSGFNYSLQVDYLLRDGWSVNLAGGYNLTMSKEKHGIRASGLRLGLGYCW